MKYGMRERISGGVILIALAVIFIPMLFDDPAPREARPEPMLTIEQPVPVTRQDVPDPQPPASLGTTVSPEAWAEAEAPDPQAAPTPPSAETQSDAEAPASPETAPTASASPPEVADAPSAPEASPAAEAAPAPDPIAELARAAARRLDGADDASSVAQGEWSVQLGSFGEPANAERLETRLKAQGYAAYRRQRDNALTTVYVGPFATSEEGERVMGELKEAVNLQGLLVRMRP